DHLVREIADLVAARRGREHAGGQPPIDGQALRRLRHEIRIAILLHELGDATEGLVPGDRLPFVGTRRAVLGKRQAARAVDEVDERCTLRAQRAAIDRVIRIALDVEDTRAGILRAIAEAVHQNATGHGTVGTGIACLGGPRQLEFAYFGQRCGGGEAEQHEARARQGSASYLQELAPRHVSHGKSPLACLQTGEVYTPLRRGATTETLRTLRCGAYDRGGRRRCGWLFCYARATAGWSQSRAGSRGSDVVLTARRSRGLGSHVLARWQSGHAAACKAVYAGSIPTLASRIQSDPTSRTLPAALGPRVQGKRYRRADL